MQKFLKTFINLSNKVYKQLGGYEERFIQMAVAVELREHKIDFLRETNISLANDWFVRKNKENSM